MKRRGNTSCGFGDPARNAAKYQEKIKIIFRGPTFKIAKRYRNSRTAGKRMSRIRAFRENIYVNISFAKIDVDAAPTIT